MICKLRDKLKQIIMKVKIIFDTNYVDCEGYEDVVDKNHDLFNAALEDIREKMVSFVSIGIIPRIGERLFTGVSDGIFLITEIYYDSDLAISFYFKLEEWTGNDYRR